MQSIMLIAESPDLLPEFERILEPVFPTAFISEIGGRPGFVIDLSVSSRIWVEYAGTDLERIGWEPLEVAAITQHLPKQQHIYEVAYHDVNAVKLAIIHLADSDEVLVDNDCGDLMSGAELVKRIKNNPNWDWLRDS